MAAAPHHCRLVLLLLVFLPQWLMQVVTCNEAVCGSIVLKCRFLKLCECQITPGEPCSCCESCKKCLDYLLEECCSYVGLCRQSNVTQLTHESVVFDIDNPPVTLWEALWASEASRDDKRWNVLTFPVDLHPADVVSTGKKKAATAVAYSSSAAQGASANGDGVNPKVTVNCTVAYLVQRASKWKCKNNCYTLGASSARWFEDGCCECVGHNCPAYGIKEARCADDGDVNNDDLEELTDEELDQEMNMLEKEVYNYDPAEY